ncbi:MAG: transcriptional regulator MntR [Verrucomicrobiota bacterium]|nr:transcriptional regulator MntR [Verrucomicrobiota bacterium]MEC8659997.1 transcriptional regulator MntR [Verrucomicrobiota bacterium]
MPFWFMNDALETEEKPKKGSRAREDYLEQISTLIEEKGYARVVDIAQNLNISQASVTGMIQRMDSDGLVSYEKYRGVILTAEGEKIATAIIKRHKSLTEFFNLFGLNDEETYQDIEGMEHHMNPNTLRTIQALTDELQRQPALLSRVRDKVSAKS